VALHPEDVPTALAKPSAAQSVAPTDVRFEDSRDVTLDLVVDAGDVLSSPVEGRVTASTCAAGSVVASGSAPFAVNWRPLVALATSIPLWRAIKVGERGADVVALANELSRLGHAADSGDALTARTVGGYRELLSSVGAATDGLTEIDPAGVIWLPETDVVIAECEVGAGARVEEGADLASLPGDLVAGRLREVPPNAAPGPRLVIVDGAELPMDATGEALTVEGLADLELTASYASELLNAEDKLSVTAQWRLATPVDAVAVPASSVYGIGADGACVLTDTGAARVTIVGSQLGRTFVVPLKDENWTQVAFDPPASAACPELPQ
jgi:hypothetical protein